MATLLTERRPEVISSKVTASGFPSEAASGLELALFMIAWAIVRMRRGG
jgi:hypothetical protein